MCFFKTKAEGDDVIVPTWTEADPDSVLTLSEVWESLRNRGWSIQVSLYNAHLHVLVTTNPLSPVPPVTVPATWVISSL
jgi:hypothetical protein